MSPNAEAPERAKATIQVLVRKEWFLDETGAIKESWLAQGLEKDISAVGATMNGALLSFQRIYCGYLILSQDMNRDILGGIQKAPIEWWLEFRRASPPESRPMKIDFTWDAEVGGNFEALPEILFAVA